MSNKHNKLFKQVELFEKLAVYGDRSTFLTSLGQEMAMLENQMQPDVHQRPLAQKDWEEERQKEFGTPRTIPMPPAAKPSVVQTTPQTISAMPPVNKDEQEALGRIVSVEGLGMPLEIDGKMGPKTKSALQAFKTKFNVQQLSDKDALMYAKMMADNNPKYKMA